MLKDGKSLRQIQAATGYNYSAIRKLCSKHFPGLFKAKGGHPSLLTTANLCYATRLIQTGKADTAPEVARALGDVTGRVFNSQTMHRALKKTGLKAVVKQKRPVLSARHRHERLDFALAHQHWTVEDWKQVIWSDETKINCIGSDGRKWVWKKPGEGLSDRLVEGTLKFGGGSLMMWGCMGWEGVGYSCKIDGKMDADLYVSILDDELEQSMEYLGKTAEDMVFQQDNDPKHTSKKAQRWFQEHDIKTMVWPAQSPDLNPIEHLWNHLKRKLAEYPEPPQGITELWERVEKEWEAIDKAVCQNLIESMPRRVQEVLKANGGYTKY